MIGETYSETVTKREGGTFRVTQEDIDNGDLEAPEESPVALALARALGDRAKKVCANHEHLEIMWKEDDCSFIYKTTYEIRVFWENYHGWRYGTHTPKKRGPSYVKPTEFYLDFIEH